MQPPTPTNVTPPKPKSAGGKKFLTVLSWVFAVILLLAGFGAFASKEILPGLFTLALGLLLLPPLARPLHVGKIARITGVVVWVLVIGATAKSTDKAIAPGKTQPKFGQQFIAKKGMVDGFFGNKSGFITVEVQPTDAWKFGHRSFWLRFELLKNQGIDRYQKFGYNVKIFTEYNGDFVAEYDHWKDNRELNRTYEGGTFPSLVSIDESKKDVVKQKGQVFVSVSEYNGQKIVKENLWIGNVNVE